MLDKVDQPQRLIKIDEGTFRQTARILSVINGEIYAEHGFYDLMESMTYQYGLKSAYFGTAGFYICMFDDDYTHHRHAKAVLMPYTVERYLKEIGRM